MAKRPRETMENPILPEINAPKYRRVAPKQDIEVIEQPNASTTTSDNYTPNTNWKPFPSSNTLQKQQHEPHKPPSPEPQTQVKFETAIEFLDQVKLQFGATPNVYKQFLKIMKDFKLHVIDTPGVIARVSELFRGHNHLILGFNRFLPEGYKITLNDIGIPVTTNNAVPSVVNQNQIADSAPQILSSVENEKNTLATKPPQPQMPSIDAMDDNPAVTESIKPQPELDHARNYVKKIKVRFESKPEIYKAFLRILHTFHEEHHTIRDVYVKVAELFSDHPDLLTEFKQFLPDKTAINTSPRGSRRLKSTRKTKVNQDYARILNNNDYDFFESARQQLRNELFLFNDFLKLLQLYNDDILTRIDLLLTTRDLFSEYPELFEEFRQFCNFTDVGILPAQSERSYSSPSRSPYQEHTIDSRCEIDFSTCKHYGTSYRGLPEEFVQPSCAGRTDLCHEVLNDHWISVPTGSEDGFKASRKNQYEEILFSCEDERYELDMIMEQNTATIRALTPIVQYLVTCSQEDLLSFRLEDGLDIIHMRAIERVYGNKGNQILQVLCENPVMAIPTVLKRLKQKDQEWQASKSKWNTVWQEINEKNYIRSLDHQSTFFKQKDKKELNARELLSEIRDPSNQQSPNTPMQGDLSNDEKPLELTFEMKQRSLFSDIQLLIETQAKKMYSSFPEPEKLQSFIRNFISQFFIPPINDDSESKDKPLLGLFFGNNPFYIFFRYYQILYNRLLEAKKLVDISLKKGKSIDSAMKKIMSGNNSNLNPTFMDSNAMYKHYLENLLIPFIDGTLDSSQYEDLCRDLFGISAFILFTMDSLLKVLVKQICSIFLEETSSKLFTLHSYEAARSNGFLESIYYTNALNITGSEERCFKFKYLTLEGKFTIRVLDPEHKPAMIGLPKETNVKKHNVFLLRNHAKTSKSSLMDKPTIANSGLECKVCTSTYRLFYVEETEDFFYRPGQLAKVRNQKMDKKIEHLHKWIDKKLSL